MGLSVLPLAAHGVPDGSCHMKGVDADGTGSHITGVPVLPLAAQGIPQRSKDTSSDFILQGDPVSPLGTQGIPTRSDKNLGSTELRARATDTESSNSMAGPVLPLAAQGIPQTSTDTSSDFILQGVQVSPLGTQEIPTRS